MGPAENLKIAVGANTAYNDFNRQGPLLLAVSGFDAHQQERYAAVGIGGLRSDLRRELIEHWNVYDARHMIRREPLPLQTLEVKSILARTGGCESALDGQISELEKRT